MNHAQWSIDLVNRSRVRDINASQTHSRKHKTIREMIIKERQDKSKEKIVLDADETQLDIALDKRSKIFKERVS